MGSGRKLAANGGLMRSPILSVIGLMRKKFPVKDIIDICKTTHWDGRCIMSCVFVGFLVYSLLLGIKPSLKIKQMAYEICKQHIQQFEEPDIHTFGRGVPKSWIDWRFVKDDKYDLLGELRYYASTSFMKLQADKKPGTGYTYLCMAAGVWVYDLLIAYEQSTSKTALDFKKIIMAIAKECGDADTNGAVAGAMAGAWFGYNKLPQDWIKTMPHSKWLDDKIDIFLNKYF
jgi:ADP-ribosylglycohydrolase